MNHWIEKRKAKRRFDLTIIMEGYKAKLAETRVILRESINSIDVKIDTSKQNTEELGNFYHILGSVFIDLSSFTDPSEATLIVLPNDQSKDGFTISGAIALSTNFCDIANNEEDLTVEVSFSYTHKSNLPYLSI